MKKKIQALELGCLGLSAVPTLANYKTLRCFYKLGMRESVSRVTVINKLAHVEH